MLKKQPTDITVNFEALIEDTLNLGATRAAWIKPSEIPYSEEFRGYCEQNKCGQYGKNWMCPPRVGPIKELIERVIACRYGLLFQTVHPVKHSFDRKGMAEGAREHGLVMKRIRQHIYALYEKQRMISLGAGPCLHCPKCACLDGKACYFPDEAISSLEAYGIDVNALTGMYGMPYHHGKNTISYVGCLLFSDIRTKTTSQGRSISI